MDEFLTRLMLGVAVQKFHAFTLVLVRMAGLMTIGPVFGQRIVPIHVRIFLVIALSLLVTPTLETQTQIGFHRLDANKDGRLMRDEVPEQLQARFDRLQRRAGKQPNEPLTESEFLYSSLQLAVPKSAVGYAFVAAGEFAMGMMLGLGVLIMLSGLQLAGELIDQQTGFSLGELSNPGLGIHSSISGQFLYLFGVTVLLLMKPFNGHLMLVGSLMETFQTIPVGEATLNTASFDLLSTLVQQSLVLGVKVAAPLLAVMSLVAIAMGFLGHTVPQLNILVIGFPIRTSVSLFVLALMLAGTSDLLVDALSGTIDTIRQHLTGLE